MKQQDEALAISNPRLLSAVYFGLLAIISTTTIDSALYSLGVTQFVPIAHAVALAAVIAACFGALFGKRIIQSKRPYRAHVFWWAFLMVILAIPVYNLGFLFLFKEYHAELFANATVAHLVYLYFFILLYNFMLVGIWLALIAGIAALYLRGYIVYYILQSLNVRQHNLDKENETSNKDKPS